MGRLVLVSIGPVQDFIAAARTSRDLAAGSRLLDRGVRLLQDYLRRQHSAEVVYPSASDQAANLPNRFLCRMGGDFNPHGLECELRRELTALVRDAAGEAGERLAMDGAAAQRDEQLGALFECHLAVVEEAGRTFGARTFGDSWKELARQMAARKACRDFGVYAGDSREKCTLCGQWEQMGGEEPDRKNMRLWWDRLRRQSPWTHRIGPHERLCGVCLTKRIMATTSEDVERVRSTEDVATGPWKAAVDQLADLHGLRDAFVRTLDPVIPRAKPDDAWQQYAGEWLLHEDLLRAVKEKLHGDGDDEAARRIACQIAAARAALVSATIEAGVRSAPSRYLAVLHADGDRMGRILSAAAEAEEGKNALREISQRLSKFAYAAKEIIQRRADEGAECIYTGGDDVLALLPLACALQVSEELRQAYANARIIAGGKQSTLSVGLAVGHVRYPLQILLEAARQAEKRAKEHYDRDAFCIRLVKRSGETVMAGAKWTAGDDAVADVLDRLRRAFSDGASDRWVYHFQRERGALEGLTQQPRAAAKEVERLIGRSWNEGGEGARGALKTEVPKLLPALFASASEVSDAADSQRDETQRWAGVLEDFGNLCHIASFLARGGRA